MRVDHLVLLVLLACGCVGGGPQTTETSSTLPQAATSTSLEATTTTLEEVDVMVPESSTTTMEPATTTTVSTTTSTTLNPLIKTFADIGGPICYEGGKPIVRMWGKFDCDHCLWVGPAFDKVAAEYDGRIVSHHWVFDKDSVGWEGNATMPQQDADLFFGADQETVTYFNFGCRFTRSGNGYYVRGRLDLEEAEFKAIIDQLLASDA